MAPLEGDGAALSAQVRGCGLVPRDVQDVAALETAVAEHHSVLFVVITHEACGVETGRALRRIAAAEPDWSRLPMVFLISGADAPPPACRVLAEGGEALPSLMLERPVPARVLRTVFATQAENRRRQFATRDLLARLSEAEARQRFLLDELRHRGRNSLAVLQAIFGIAARGADSVGQLRQTFLSRLHSLSRAHAALTAEGDSRRGLRAVLEDHLAPYCTAPRQLSLDGPEIVLRPSLAFDLALIVHELATNAAKHGALSVAEGHVVARWSRRADRGAEIVWTESGGPPVAPPTREGLGATIINRPPSNLIEAQARFDPAGLVWRARIEAEGLA